MRPTILKSLFHLSLTTVLGLGLAACGSGPSAAGHGETVAEPSASSAPAQEDESGGEVAYEPAYPEDVSEEGLSETDVAQQEATHSHDGGEHSHDDGTTHSHEDEDEDEHSHGEGGSSHEH